MSKLLTERQQIRDVLAAWNVQYPGGDPWGTASDLAKLDLETASANRIAAIIGNDSWVAPKCCDECGSGPSWNMIRVGEEPSYDSSTAILCFDCLRKAVALVEEASDE